jgi:DNA-binding transcriptional LysR family regulator
MKRTNSSDLLAFLSVARTGSFTRAAAQLGVSPSAISHTMRALEERLGVRLLTRTTRSVSLTEAGEWLFERVGPRFEAIDAELAALSDFRDKPAGTIRISTGEHVAESLILPALKPLLVEYPDIKVELNIDYELIDIVTKRFDAGVRVGDQVAKDMIAVRIGPDMSMAVVGSPQYFAERRAPRRPHELTEHNCIGLRSATHGGIFHWEFEKRGKVVKVRPDGQLIFNNLALRVHAALDGVGLAYVPADHVSEHIEDGRLIRVLADWCPRFPGYHLYYPSRRQPTPAFAVVVDALRFRKRGDEIRRAIVEVGARRGAALGGQPVRAGLLADHESQR